MTDSYDCIVVGEDCAALSAVALCASAGFKTLLLTPRVPTVLPCDLLLPVCAGLLERLKLLSSLAAFLTPQGQALQVVDARGNLALSLDGQSSGDVRYWRPTAELLRRLLIQAAEQNGAQILSCSTGIQIHRFRPDRWRVKWDDSTGNLRYTTASLLIDTRLESFAESTWTEIRGQYRNAGTLNSQCAAMATPALDNAGWCALTPLANGLTSVRILYDGSKRPSTGGNLAELWEDRLVQAPILLEYLAEAELAVELCSAQLDDCDPWGVFRDSCDLVLGEQLASRVLEAFRTGGMNSIAAPFGRRDAAGPYSRIRSALVTLFGQETNRTANSGYQSEAVIALNQALKTGRPSHSPFLPAGDEAILTRA